MAAESYVQHLVDASANGVYSPHPELKSARRRSNLSGKTEHSLSPAERWGVERAAGTQLVRAR